MPDNLQNWLDAQGYRVWVVPIIYPIADEAAAECPLGCGLSKRISYFAGDWTGCEHMVKEYGRKAVLFACHEEHTTYCWKCERPMEVNDKKCWHCGAPADDPDRPFGDEDMPRGNRI